MAMLKVYRGPSETAALGKAEPDTKDPAKSMALPGVPVVSVASKVGAPHKKGVKTLGQKALKPKATIGSKTGY